MIERLRDFPRDEYSEMLRQRRKAIDELCRESLIKRGVIELDQA